MKPAKLPEGSTDWVAGKRGSRVTGLLRAKKKHLPEFSLVAPLRKPEETSDYF